MGRRNRRGEPSWNENMDELAATDGPPPEGESTVRSPSPNRQPGRPQPVAAESKPRKAEKQARSGKAAGGFVPLDPFPAAAAMLGEVRLAQITWALIGLGVAVRLIRYLLNFPLWPDEAYLAHNYLDRGYLQLLQPLDYGQVAPLLYLWLQKTVVAVCGFSESSLRLTAVLGSIASLFLFRHLAGRLLDGVARLMAIGTFAVAYPLIRYAAEAKPYGTDMLVTLLLLVLLVEWRLDRAKTRWLWGLAAAMPIAVLLSYPALFVVPAIGLAMMIELFRSGTLRQWLAWLGLALASAGGVALLYFASAHAQMDAAGPHMRTGWENAFPPLHSAKQMALFLLESNTSEAFSYPAGGSRGASSLTTICCLAALVLLLRGRRFWLATLFAVPLILNFTAAALHAYPYGGHSRVMLYMAPIVCLVTGLGAAGILSLLQNRRWPAAAPAVAAVVLLAAVGGIASVRDFLKPYKETCWQRNRDFARWFWADKALGAELVCVSTDLKQPVSSAPGGDDLASVYFCNQRIYSRRIAHGLPANLDEVTQDRPLRCARFRPSAATGQDEAKFKEWLQTMEAKYRLVAREKYPLTFFVHESELQCVDQVEMYEFVPFERQIASRAASAAPVPPGDTRSGPQTSDAEIRWK
jgi:4-amino-4-deoxy-L-arabinose transferase-like glycosyltransferase